MGTLSKKKKQIKKTPRDFVSWFEIPALDLSRSVAFYNHIFDMQMEVTETPDYAMALFPVNKGIGGAVVVGQGSYPSETGCLIYLNAGKNLSIALDKVSAAGGRVIMGKTFINDESGHFALFIDSEGNKLALHSTD
jgi:predicted enzyme related to lactoylglutathione lyase